MVSTHCGRLTYLRTIQLVSLLALPYFISNFPNIFNYKTILPIKTIDSAKFNFSFWKKRLDIFRL